MKSKIYLWYMDTIEISSSGLLEDLLEDDPITTIIADNVKRLPEWNIERGETSAVWKYVKTN